MMADHAPQSPSAIERLQRWLHDVPDIRLSLYMLTTAGAIVMSLMLIDALLF